MPSLNDDNSHLPQRSAVGASSSAQSAADEQDLGDEKRETGGVAVFSPQEAEEFWEEAFALANELNYYIETSGYPEEIKFILRAFIPFMAPEQMIELLDTLKDVRAVGLFPTILGAYEAGIKKILKDLQKEQDVIFDKTLTRLEQIVEEEERKFNTAS